MGKKILTWLAWAFGIAAIVLVLIYGLVIAATQFWFLAIAALCAIIAIWFACLVLKIKRHETEREERKLEEEEQKDGDN